jgi:hypothetical protein
MKKVIVCAGCGSVTVNGVPELSTLAIVKLLITTRVNPKEIDLTIIYCATCRQHFGNKYCDDKLMKYAPTASS